VAINMKRPCIHNRFAIKFAGLKDKPLIAPAKNRSLARAVDEYQRLRACASWDCDELRFHARARKSLAMQCPSLVIA
jgi:hypothetical protein